MVYKEHQEMIVVLSRVLDLVVVVISFLAAIEIRKRMEFYPLEPFAGSFFTHWKLLLLTLVIWASSLYWNKVYISHRGRRLTYLAWLITKSNTIALLALVTVLFFLQQHNIHRTLVLLFTVICTLLLILEKTLLLTILKYLRRRGTFLKYAIVVGSGDDVGWLVSRLKSHDEVGIQVIGVIDHHAGNRREIDGLPTLGNTDQMEGILKNHVVDEVFVTSPMEDLHAVNKIVTECENSGVNVRILARGFVQHHGRMFIDEFLDTPFISFSTRPLNTVSLHVKPLIDCLVSIVLLLLLLPVFVAIAIAIKLDSKGPVIFKQARIGKNGRVFDMYKFRSMFNDAQHQKEGLGSKNFTNGPTFKIRNDPRVTRFGRVLRRTSADELPQLVNVLFGAMSLVGPRPLPTDETKKIDGMARRRHSMKPGMTGLWQISGRSDIGYQDWMRLDLEYIDRWSLTLDARILAKTILVLLSGKGAY